MLAFKWAVLGLYMAKALSVSKTLRILFYAFCLLQSAAPVVAFDRVLGHGGPVKDVALAPQGDLLASVSFDYSVVLWDSADFGEKYRLLGHNAPVVTAAFSPDGRFLATGGNFFQVSLQSFQLATHPTCRIKIADLLESQYEFKDVLDRERLAHIRQLHHTFVLGSVVG